MKGRSNVTRLPTASTRRVQQKRNKASRAAKAALRDGQGQQFPYLHPKIRAAMLEAKLILGCTRSPTLAMALAIWAALSDETRDKAESLLSRMAADEGAARHALALVKRRTIAERVDLDAAFDLINGGADHAD
jgi:hypothetical protein